MHTAYATKYCDFRNINSRGLFLFSIDFFSSSLPEVACGQSEVFENIPECKEGEADEEAESSPKVGDQRDKSVTVNLQIEKLLRGKIKNSKKSTNWIDIRNPSYLLFYADCN